MHKHIIKQKYIYYIMKVSPLIKGQVIFIDPHRRKYSAQWDNLADDIHLHKKTNKGKDEYTIKIPLNSLREVSILKNNKKTKRIPQSISREVAKAFENDKVREAFVKDVVDAVKNYNDSKKSQEQKARQAMGNLKNAFGLDTPRATIKGWIRNSLKLYSQLFEIKGTTYCVTLTRDLFVVGEMTPLSFVEVLRKTEVEKSAKWRFEITDEIEL